jgi:metal-responsive CopG/Arc/MetJ family transcriptional regulator
MPASDEYVRIQFDMPKDSVEELDSISKAANIRTRKELFNNALTLFKYMIKQRQQGKRIFIAGADGQVEKEFEMPVFEQVKQIKLAT